MDLVGKVMSLLFNILSRLVITFLPRSKRLLISWLQEVKSRLLLGDWAQPPWSSWMAQNLPRTVLSQREKDPGYGHSSFIHCCLRVLEGEKANIWRGANLLAREKPPALRKKLQAPTGQKVPREYGPCCVDLKLHTLSIYEIH